MTDQVFARAVDRIGISAHVLIAARDRVLEAQ